MPAHSLSIQWHLSLLCGVCLLLISAWLQGSHNASLAGRNSSAS